MTGSSAISGRPGRDRATDASADSSSSTADRFVLSGPSLRLDTRIHAYRPDIADIALAGQLFAPHYARALQQGCGPQPAFIHPSPSQTAPISSELLPGEEFAVLDCSGGWAWGYGRADHYVGYVRADALGPAIIASHVVVVPEAAGLPMGARVASDAGFAPGEVWPVGVHEDDPVAVAERLLGAPYLLGGRTLRGIDCSGLVQLAFALCGIQAPRDSDQQAALGISVPAGDPLRRGDLITFAGHVGLMVDDRRLIHATAHSGATVIEPLADVDARNPVLDRRRL